MAYAQPMYLQQQPVYAQPQPMYAQPAPPPPVAMPGAPGGMIVDVHAQKKEERVCQSCKETFDHHKKKYGIKTIICCIILLTSIFVLPLLLMICFCNKHQVCPKCEKWTGYGESNEVGICLCC